MINLNSEEVRQNPYPAYEEVRRAGPAVYDTKRNVWYVGRYDDVSEILRNHKCLSNRETGFESTLHGADGTLHSQNRNIVLPAFTPERVAELGAAIRSLVDELVADVAVQDRCELIRDLASRVPAAVVAWLLGIDDSRRADISRWSAAIVHGGTRRRKENHYSWPLAAFRSTFRRFANKKLTESASIISECEAFLIDHFNRAIQNPNGSWLTDTLVSHHKSNNLTKKELIDIGLLLIVAGNETTTDLIGNAALLLATNPDIQAQLRNEPKLVEPFIEEVLRYDSPVQRRLRIATSSIKIDDVDVPAGSHIEILIGSANRDPEKFPNANQFQFNRNPNRHFAFGAGAHFCLGAQFARLESNAVINALIRQLPAMTLVNPGQYIEYPQAFSLRGPRQLHIKFG